MAKPFKSKRTLERASKTKDASVIPWGAQSCRPWAVQLAPAQMQLAPNGFNADAKQWYMGRVASVEPNLSLIRPKLIVMAWLAVVAGGMLQGAALEWALGPRSPAGLLWVFAAGATGAFVSVPVVLVTARLARGQSRVRALLVHALGAAIFSVSCMGFARAIAVGLGVPPAILLPLPEMVLFDLQNTLPLYAGLALAYGTYCAWLREREAERQAATLAEQLAATRLSAVRARLQPELVFAALAAARAALPDHPAACDRHIQTLADALRLLSEQPRAPIAAVPELPKPELSAHVVSADPPRRAWLLRYVLLLPLILAASVALARAMAFAHPEFTTEIYIGSAGRAVGVWLSLPVTRLVSRFSTGRSEVRRWPARVLTHLAGFSVFSLVWVSAAALVRDGLSQLFRVGFPDLSWRAGFLLESQRLTFVYIALCAGHAAVHALRTSHARELAARALRTALTDSQLEALNARVDPHFLFNALNTLSSLAYTDGARAAQLIDALGELHEAALSSHGPDWTLREEQLYTRRFVEFLSARFGERVRVEIRLPEALLGVRVPRLSLQTLVENAVKHNQSKRRTLTVVVEAVLREGTTVLTVSDNGLGFSQALPSTRGGLARLRHTLELLYGAHARLCASAGEPRGARVELWIPTGREAC
jgi:two-component system LytT family sensor kinase